MTNKPPVNGDVSNPLRDAVGRLAGTVLRSELAGIRDVVLAVRGAIEGGGVRSRTGPNDLQAFARLYIEYLERLTETTWGFRQELERFLTGELARRPPLAFTPSTLELGGAAAAPAGAFSVQNMGPVAVEVELAHGPLANTATGEPVEGLRVEISPSAFEVPAGGTVGVAVSASGSPEVPPGEYRTQLLSLRDLRWPVEVLIPWRADEAAPAEAAAPPAVEEILAPAYRASDEELGGAAAPAVPETGGVRRRRATRPRAVSIDLATATVAQLARIEGVSRTVAAEIVATRERAGGVLRVEDLRTVRGVGPKLAAKIAAQAKPA